MNTKEQKIVELATTKTIREKYTRQQIADMVGVTRDYVQKVIRKHGLIKAKLPLDM